MVEINARHRGNAENCITEIREHLFLSFPRNGKSCSFDAGEKKNRNTSWQNASDEEQELSREVAVSFGDRYVEILEASVLANAYMEGKLHIRILKLD